MVVNPDRRTERILMTAAVVIIYLFALLVYPERNLVQIFPFAAILGCACLAFGLLYLRPVVTKGQLERAKKAEERAKYTRAFEREVSRARERIRINAQNQRPLAEIVRDLEGNFRTSAVLRAFQLEQFSVRRKVKDEERYLVIDWPAIDIVLEETIFGGAVAIKEWDDSIGEAEDKLER